jgi:hypothetical protein
VTITTLAARRDEPRDGAPLPLFDLATVGVEDGSTPRAGGAAVQHQRLVETNPGMTAARYGLRAVGTSHPRPRTR